MTTTLEPEFLRAVVLLTAFKPDRMVRAQAALLMLGFNAVDFTAAHLPGEITDGNKHVAGAATGSLIAIGLLRVTGREKSPRKDAKGRKLDTLRLVSAEKAKAWLTANGFKAPEFQQETLL